MNLPLSYTGPLVSVTEMPTLPTVTLPEVKLPMVPSVSLPKIVSPILADNELHDLHWQKPNPPRPISNYQSYKRMGCIGDGSCLFHVISKALSEVYQLSYQNWDTVTEEILRRFEQSSGNTITFPSTLFTTHRQTDLNTVYEFKLPYGKSMFESLLDNYRRINVKLLRQDLANQILNDDRMKSLISKRFAGVIEERVNSMAVNSQLTLDQIKLKAFHDISNKIAQELLCGNPVKPDFILLISDYIDVDIYLLRDLDLVEANPRTTPIYGGASLHESVHGPSDMRPHNDRYQRLPDRQSMVIISIDDTHYDLVVLVHKSENSSICKISPTLSSDEPIIRKLYEMLFQLRSMK